jgi:transposase InsO family protein/transposase
MSPKIIKKYPLKLKKSVIESKLKGVKDSQIIKKFGLNNDSIIYVWLKKIKIKKYSGKKNFYSFDLKKAVIEAKQEGMKDKEIIQKFNLKSNSFIYDCLRKFQINDYPNQLLHYSFETKLKAIFLKKEGLSNQEIQKKLRIKNKTQIKTWVKLFNQKKIHTLQQKRGVNYRYQKDPQFNNPLLENIKKELKKLLGLNKKKNKQLYLKVIRKYTVQISLNQLLKMLNLSKTTYYRWINQSFQLKPISFLDKAIIKIARRNRYYNQRGQGTFLLGYRRLCVKLRKIGFKVNPKTVYRKMKKFTCLCQTLKNRYLNRPFFHAATKRSMNVHNLLQNNFKSTKPYQKLCTDLIFLSYGDQNKFMYLSVIIDLFNREVLAYHLSDKPDTNLVLKTLDKLPQKLNHSLIHSDKGIQYMNHIFKKAIQLRGLKSSFSEARSPKQNSVMESFFATLRSELFFLEDPKQLNPDLIQKKVDVFMKYYNQKRQLKYLGYLSPLQFKKQYEQNQPRI